MNRWAGTSPNVRARFAGLRFALRGADVAAYSVVAFLAFLLSVVAAQQALADSQPIRREVLAVYDSREEQQADDTRIHRFAEMPLNYLGFVVNYWDISQGPPPEEKTANIRGIVTWFNHEQSAEFYVWALAMVSQGARVAMLGEGGVAQTDQPLPEAQQLFNAIGFEMGGPTSDLTYATRVVSKDSVIGFERPLDLVLPPFPTVRGIADDVASHLVLQHREAGDAYDSSVVLTTGRGGFAASEYILYIESATQQTKWIIDPFRFFQGALGSLAGPIPDTTTLSGRRVYFSHIDGDGWNNVSQISEYHDAHLISAEVVLRQLITPYPDLPVSVGVIGADIDPRYGPVEAARRSASALFQLPQVEVAVHSYTHPYEWAFFENYDPALEAQRNDNRGDDTLKGRVGHVAEKLFPGIVKKYADEKPSENAPPRTFGQFPFDLDQEIGGAVQIAQELSPPGKPVKLYLWSGEADPFERAVAASRRLGVRNMNGGDTRFDPDYPSLTYVSPLARPIGAERQVYAADSNDFLYINRGQGREHGFVYLQATLTATEAPRRLKPVDIYYHMYAGETAAQLAAVRYNLDEARKMALAPVAASQYAATVDGFMTTEIASAGSLKWTVSNRGALQTVRFDDAESLELDLANCVGVIGQNRKGSTLYIALDEAHDDAVVTLLPKEAQAAPQNLPYLIDSRWQFHDLDRQDCGFSVTAQGFGAGQMHWGGLTPGKYHVSAQSNKKTVWEAAAEITDSGQLDLTVDANATQPLVITAACEDRGEQSQ